MSGWIGIGRETGFEPASSTKPVFFFPYLPQEDVQSEIDAGIEPQPVLGSRRMTKTQIDKLVEEFEAHVGLSPTESRRSAFIALAAAQRWNNARIGRYLGVHRQRISQKLDKYQQYIESDEMPMLAKVMENVKPGADTTPGVVAFSPNDWEDTAFAAGMLAIVSDIEFSAKAA